MSEPDLPPVVSDEQQAASHAQMAQGMSAAVREAVMREHRSLLPAVIFDASAY